MTAAPANEWTAIAESAVRRAVQLAMQRVLSEDEAVLAAMAELEERRASVTTKERQEAENARLLARHDELVARGRGHNAAMMVAREFGEPHEWETIADRIRRLRARREKRAA